MWFQFLNRFDIRKIIYASYTDAGSRPGVNQDSVLAIKRDDLALFCVADGLGGHSRGDIASKELVDRLKSYVDALQNPFDGTPAELFDGLEKVVEEVNDYIFKYYNQNAICGTTVVLLVICNKKFCIITAGDSRIYRKDDGEMIQISRDDVWENQVGAVDNAALNGKLLKSVGTDEGLICNRFAGEIKSGDEFFLCSDGIYKVMGDEYMKNLSKLLDGIENNNDAESVLKTIKELVDEKGAPDNNTGIIVKC